MEMVKIESCVISFIGGKYMISININGKGYDVSKNATVLQACHQLGIDIPTLCYDDRLEPEASCNLCVVEVDSESELKTSCSIKVKEGMKIKTNTDKIIAARKEVLSSLLSKNPHDCSKYGEADRCRLHSYCDKYEISSEISTIDRKRYPIDHSNLFYDIDPNKCILCNLCMRVCEELQGRSALEINDKGYISKKPISADTNSHNFECEDCGNCIAVCPTGALVPKRYTEEYAKIEEIRDIKTTCPYCGVGCQLELIVEGEQIVDVKPVKVLPNNGLLCVKGRFGYKFVNHPDRLKTPLIKKNGEFVEATWEEAFSLIIEKANQIKKQHGSQVFAGLSSAKCTNEENYLFQKLMRAGFGTNNIDHCARL